MFTRAYYQSAPWASWIHSTYPDQILVPISVFFHYTQIFQVVFFLQVFPPKPCIHFSSLTFMLCTPHGLVLLHLFIWMIFGEEFKLWSCCLYPFFWPPVTARIVCPNIAHPLPSDTHLSVLHVDHTSANCWAHHEVCIVHIVRFVLCTLWVSRCAHCEVHVVYIVRFVLCTLWSSCIHCEVCVVHIVSFTLCTLWGSCCVHCEVCVVHIVRFVLCTLWISRCAHCEVHAMYIVRFVLSTLWGLRCAHCEVHVVYIVRFALCTLWGLCFALCEVHVVTSRSVHSWSWILWCLITILEA